MFTKFHIQIRVHKLRLWAFSRGSGGFRELREAGRKHFHLSWYLSVPVVTSYGQKPLGGTFSCAYGRFVTPYSMNRLFIEFFKKFGGVFWEVFETI